MDKTYLLATLPERIEEIEELIAELEKRVAELERQLTEQPKEVITLDGEKIARFITPMTQVKED